MPRFMGFVRMEEGIGAPPQALFEAMDTYIGEQAAAGSLPRRRRSVRHRGRGELRGPQGRDNPGRRPVRRGQGGRRWVGVCCSTTASRTRSPGQQEFAELHATYWPECEMVATLRQIPDGAAEAADA